MISDVKWILFAIFIFNIAFASDKKTKINEEPNPELIAEMLKNIDKKTEENFKVPDECMVCYENFPVSFKFPCGHEVCAVCVQSIFKLSNNNKCPYCRAHFSIYVKEWLTMIKIYTIHLIPDIPLEKLQIVFPLICSIANLTTVAKCVKMGIDINTEGFLGFFPVQLASQKDVLKYLVDNGANVNERRINGLTPLILNCENGNLSVVKYLVENGAKVDQPNNDGVTPLFMSCQEGHLLVVKYLVENCANVNQDNNYDDSPLFISSYEGHLPVVKYLVEHGANVNQRKYNGSTPLHVSSQEGNLSVVQYLIENGAKVNQAKNSGATPLFTSSYKGHLLVVKYLVKNGANVNQANKLGVTPLFMSSQEGHLLVVEYLVENGGNVNQHNDRGATPLGNAIYNNKIEVAKFLLKKNADIEATKLFFEICINCNSSEYIDILDKLCKEMEDTKF